MALIICPECGEKVSDKASVCIHCGYPLGEVQNEVYQGPISVCSKCQEKISVLDDVCRHCGNRIEKEDFNEDNVCKINGVKYDMTPFLKQIKESSFEELPNIIDKLQNLTDCAGCASLSLDIYNGAALPKEFEGPTNEEIEKDVDKYLNSLVHCKYCNSTNVKRLGFLDSMVEMYSGNQWHCNKCGSNF